MVILMYEEVHHLWAAMRDEDHEVRCIATEYLTANENEKGITRSTTGMIEILGMAVIPKSTTADVRIVIPQFLTMVLLLEIMQQIAMSSDLPHEGEAMTTRKVTMAK